MPTLKDPKGVANNNQFGQRNRWWKQQRPDGIEASEWQEILTAVFGNNSQGRNREDIADIGKDWEAAFPKA